MKIIINSFQGVTKSSQLTGYVKILYEEIKDLKKQNIYYVQYNKSKENYPDLVTLSSTGYLINKIIGKIYVILNKVFKTNGGRIRYFQEINQDYFLSLKIKNPVILFTSALNPVAFEINKKKGGFNIFIAGNPSDIIVHRKMIELEKKLNIKIEDVYTYKPRIKAIDEMCKNSDIIVVNTKLTYNTYKEIYPSKKIKLIEKHIIIGKSKIKEKENKVKNENKKWIFGYIGHSVWLKGLHLLLEAWEKCNFDVNKSKLIIAGTIEKDLYKYLKNKKILRNVLLIGQVKNIEEFYNSIDMLIVPSILDNHPATITESIAYQVPIICTNTCGSSILLENNKNALIIKPEIDEIKNAMQEIITNKTMQKKIKEGIIELNKFYKNEYLNKEKNIFNEVLNDLEEVCNENTTTR